MFIVVMADFRSQISGGSRIVLRGGSFSYPKNVMTFFSRHTLDAHIHFKLNSSKPLSTTTSSLSCHPRWFTSSNSAPSLQKIASQKRTPLDPPLQICLRVVLQCLSPFPCLVLLIFMSVFCIYLKLTELVQFLNST